MDAGLGQLLLLAVVAGGGVYLIFHLLDQPPPLEYSCFSTEVLEDYLAGGLAPVIRVWVAEHLLICATCKATLEQMESDLKDKCGEKLLDELSRR